MIQIQIVNDLELIKPVICHPDLHELCGYTESPDQFKLHPLSLYLAVSKDNYKTIAGIFEFREFTKVCWEAHAAILPEYQNTSDSWIFGESIKQWLKDNTTIQSLMITVPESCKHVSKYVKKLDFKQTGIIPGGIIYNNQLMNLLIYTLLLRGVYA